VNKPYGLSQTGGFPLTQNNGSQVGALDNTIAIGSRLNWEQRLGYVRMFSNSFDKQTVVPDATLWTDVRCGYRHTGLLRRGDDAGPGFAGASPKVRHRFTGVRAGPYGTESTTINTGYFQNRLNPSTNVIFSLGKHTIVAGGGYSYTQLNIENNRNGIVNVEAKTFESFLQGKAYKSNSIDSVVPPQEEITRIAITARTRLAATFRTSGRCYSNLSITAGVRYDYHGGLTEKYGNMFNFDPRCIA
jgi:hypothetical protein